jgi:predicted RNA-binding protein with PIN domain
VTFLIDGYNLLHAVGWAPLDGRLKPARRKLLDWLADSLSQHSADLRLIFDAQEGRSTRSEFTHRGIPVRFAVGRTADDLIEELLAASSTPTGLTVVSNDLRLHESARRSGARGWTCPQFLDWLAGPEQKPPSVPATQYEKPEGSSDLEAELLQAFQMPKPK